MGNRGGGSVSGDYGCGMQPDHPDVYVADAEGRVRAFIDQHRQLLRDALDGVTEEEARRSLVPSSTTLLGLVKHATFVERVWFGEAATGTSRKELGIPETPEESFALGPEDTIASVLAEHERAVVDARRAVAGLGHETVFPGNRRGPLPLGWIELHVLRELAHHCGHADILREQILAARD